MGMKIKPSKCRSLSISSGTSSIIHFHVGPDNIPSIAEDDQKFLGCLLFFKGKSKEVFEYVRKTIITKCENIDSALVRPEYKIQIYKKYLLPSIRFLLTVHDVTATHLKALDTATDKFLKVWAGVPRSATNAVFHHSKCLNIQAISHLYQETHTLNYASSRFKGDELVNHALDCHVERESKWTGKGSTAVRSHEAFQLALSFHVVPEAVEDPPISAFPHVKEQIKLDLTMACDRKWQDHISKLVVQGKFLELATAARNDVTWNSYIYNLPSGTMKFIINASLDTLATKANLKRWGKSPSDKCPHCGYRETTNHILNCCKVYLDQGRYTWRHNNIMNDIAQCTDNSKFDIFSDIPGYTTSSGGSIPPNILVTTQKPDIVFIVKKTQKISIFELTVPFEPRISESHRLKTEKYSVLEADINNAGFQATITSFEIGSRGFIDTENKKTLKSIYEFTKKEITVKKFIDNISSLATSSSYYIFTCRKEPDFRDTPYLRPIHRPPP